VAELETGQEHLDPTAEITLETVKARAVKGVVVLTGRTFFLSLVALVATGFLTVFLEPSEFGVFWIVSAVVNFLAYFSDIGLAAALIQKKEVPTREDLRTTFTIQQGLVLAILAAVLLGSGVISRVYSLTPEGRLLLYALAFSLLLSSLKTIPSILMERSLRFDKLVIPQILENLVYNGVAVVLAWRGFGIQSFTYAVLARGIVGLIAVYFLQPWIPGFAFSKTSFKNLLSFGLPYQANTLIATLKDDGMTALLGGILGSSGVGLLGWAQKWAYTPLRLFMDHVLKVTFPAFSRMQGEVEHLKRAVTRSIFFVCFLVFPSVVGLLVLAPELVQIIPRYSKWQPALLPLALVSINTLFAASTTQLTNLLNAIGKIKITFKLMIMWAVLTWIFVPALAIKFGVNGAALGYSLVGLSSVVAIYIARKHVAFSLTEGVFKPALAAFIMGAVLLLARRLLPTSLTGVLLMVGLGVLSYFAASYLIVGSSLIEDVKKSLSNLKEK
jgi:O-antigen/teichoic acid export membrane protein